MEKSPSGNIAFPLVALFSLLNNKTRNTVGHQRHWFYCGFPSLHFQLTLMQRVFIFIWSHIFFFLLLGVSPKLFVHRLLLRLLLYHIWEAVINFAHRCLRASTNLIRAKWGAALISVCSDAQYQFQLSWSSFPVFPQLLLHIDVIVWFFPAAEDCLQLHQCLTLLGSHTNNESGRINSSLPINWGSNSRSAARARNLFQASWPTSFSCLL